MINIWEPATNLIVVLKLQLYAVFRRIVPSHFGENLCCLNASMSLCGIFPSSNDRMCGTSPKPNEIPARVNACRSVSLYHTVFYLKLLSVQLTSMPIPRCLGALLPLNGFLYAVGGTEETAIASGHLSRFDPINNSWTELAQMVEPRFDAGETIIM